MKKLACIVFTILATASAFGQQKVVRVAAIDRVINRDQEVLPGPWTAVEAPADGWPSQLGKLLDAMEARTATAPMNLLEVGRAAMEPGQERTVARAEVTLVASGADAADVKVQSATVHVPVNGTVVVGNGIHYFAVSALDAERASHTVDPVRARKSDVATFPEVISRVDPVYPEDARRARISGIVILEAEIDDQGNVVWVHVLKPLPYFLSDAAADAVRQWKFAPATVDGKPVAVLFNLTTNFKLN